MTAPVQPMSGEEMVRTVKGESSFVMYQAVWPCFLPPVHQTPKGVLYLREPGVIAIAQPQLAPVGILAEFLGGFPEEYRFRDYIADPHGADPATSLAKQASQVCYASYGPKRTKNTAEGIAKYIDNIISLGHGSVLEHAVIVLFLYGISRSLTHELVRHRAGFGFSQLSQRYVDGRVLRFVERPEHKGDNGDPIDEYTYNPELHEDFVNAIERAAERYDWRAKRLLELGKSDPEFQALPATDRRKKVNQAARACLPNETETHIVVSGNVRAWRHVINMRGSEHAETEIRILAGRILACLKIMAPGVFYDFNLEPLPDGTFKVTTPYPKV